MNVMEYVVLFDLRDYCLYYTGLLLKNTIEVKRDNNIEKERERVKSDLELLSKKMTQKMKQDKS